MNRRDFAGMTLAAIGGVFAPKFGQWYRRGSGVIVRDFNSDVPGLLTSLPQRTLLGTDGSAFGTITVIDYQARTLTVTLSVA